MPLHDAVGINCNKGAENHGAGVSVYGLRGWMIVCVI